MPGKLGMATIVGLGLVGITAAQAEEIDLDELVISAGRVPVEAEKVGRSVTVVTSEELEKHQIRHIDDALRQVPGIAVHKYGTAGSLTVVRIRGSEAKGVLVMVDGVEVSSISHGSYDFSALETAGIERIEVLRGPQSSLWGSSAMAGVINIVTKQGRRNSDPKLATNFEVGSHPSFLSSATLSGGKERFDYAFTAAWRQSAGINTSLNGSEKDKNENLTLNGRFNYDFTDDLKLKTTLRYVKAQADTEAYSGGPIDADSPFTRTFEYYASTELTHSLFDGAYVQKAGAKFSGSDNRGESGSSRYGNDAGKMRLYYQGTAFFETPNFAEAKHSLTGMFEYGEDNYKDAFASDPRVERDIQSYVAEYRGEFYDSLFVNAAVRHDRHSDSGDYTTYTGSASYKIKSTGTRLHASVGTGVSIPTFLMLYSTYYGNKNLTPEKSFGWDVGVEQTFFDDRYKIDVTYFNQDLTDEIGFDMSTYKYAQTKGESERQGIEVTASAQITDTLGINATYTYLDASNPDGSVETRRPKHTGGFRLNKSFFDGKMNTFLDANFVADRYDGSTQLEDYALVNIGADYQVTDDTQIYGRVTNLFDKDYVEVKGYNTEGVTGYLGVRHTF